MMVAVFNMVFGCNPTDFMAAQDWAWSYLWCFSDLLNIIGDGHRGGNGAGNASYETLQCPWSTHGVKLAVLGLGLAYVMLPLHISRS